MDKKTSAIKKFWDDSAKHYKTSLLATVPDKYYRELEIKKIAEYLPKSGTILDIGCGNGYSTIKFALQYKKLNFVGVDYSEKMIQYANQALKKYPQLKNRVKFITGNILALTKLPVKTKFDYIVSERCIINLLNWQEQQASLLQMKKMLKPNGKIVLCENTQEGLARLNSLRKIFKLPAINTRWHNFYVPESKFLKFIPKYFKLEKTENIGNLYYILSRVVYASLCQRQNKKPDYLNPINQMAGQLPSLGNYHFSPNFIFLLKNK